MRNITAVFVAVLVALSISGCGKKVTRVDIEEQIDLSGKWNDTDSRLVSEEMIKDCLARPWINQYHTRKGRMPTVIVGTVINKTDEHIISETFTKDLERAFINSGRVQVVASKEERKEIRQERKDQLLGFTSAGTTKKFGEEIGSDYMLRGVVNSIKDRDGRKSVMYYQIDLELIDTETNQKAWIGDKKIKKYLKR